MLGQNIWLLGGEQRLLFLHKARKGRAYVSDQRDGLLYVKRVTYEQLVYREKGQVGDQGVIKRCRLSFLTNRSPQMRGEGRSCGVSANEYGCTQEPK
jgi:hypothetical protein